MLEGMGLAAGTLEMDWKSEAVDTPKIFAPCHGEELA
jgi:hypothetical protein